MSNTISAELSMPQGGEVKVKHINLRRSRAATALLVKHAVEINAGILLLQDPYINEGKITGLPTGWNLFPSMELTAAIVVVDKTLQWIEAYKTTELVRSIQN